MADSIHSALTGADLHVPGYVQNLDPGSVGSGKLWVDTSLGTGKWAIRVRKADNSGWEAASLAPTGTSGQVLVSNGPSLAPTFQTTRHFFSGNGGAATIAAGATKYLGTTLDSTEPNVYIVFPVAGTIKNLYLYSSTAPGASQTLTATARLTLADTALTCTISGAASNSASDLTHSVAVSAGARFDIKLVASAGMTTLSQLVWAVEFDTP